MTPIEGLRFYADAVRGDWSQDGRTLKARLNSYIDWAGEVDASKTTEKDVLAKLENECDVYVVEYFELPDYQERSGSWGEHVEELILDRDGAQS